MSVESICKSAILLLRAVLPADQREWADAVRAEIGAPTLAREKVALAASGGLGLVSLACERLLTRWTRSPRALALAVAIGVSIGAIDAVSPSRLPLRLMVIGSAFAMGLAWPRSAGATGGIIGLMICLAARASGAVGPYAHDRGDAWIPLLPSVFIAMLGAEVGKRLVGSLRNEANASTNTSA